MKKRQTANLALAISACGFLGTAGVAGFLGGMVHHGFLAATIGGLADWFAVTALFRKPLGISYRTDILRRNRGRITEAIVTFTSEDLLSTENIMEIVRAQDTAGLLVGYLRDRGGRKEVIAVLRAAMLRVAADMDSASIARELTPALREGLSALALQNLAQSMCQLLSEEAHSRRILRSLFLFLREALKSPQAQSLLQENIRAFRKAYEGDSFGRAFALSLAGIDDSELLYLFNDRMEKTLDDLLAEKGESYVRAKAGLESLLTALSREEAFQKVMRRWANQLVERVDIEGLIIYWLEHSVKAEEPFWIPPFEAFLGKQIDAFCASETLQRRLDTSLKDFLEAEFRKHHGAIEGLIRERLAEFSDDALIEFVESRVEDDLQMIRINGAVVGSLVGMGLYLLVKLTEGAWGI